MPPLRIVTFDPDTDFPQGPGAEELLERERAVRAEADAARAEIRRQADLLGLAHAFVRDMDGRITLWTPGAEQLYGFTAEEAVGRMGHELLRTRFPVPLADVEAALRRDGQWRGELVHHRRDGTRLVVASAWTLRREPDGDSVLQVAHDVTAARAAAQVRERALREELAILESAGDGILGVDLDGRCTFVNPVAAALLGYRQDEIIGERIHELVHYKRADGAPYAWSDCAVHEAIATGARVETRQETLWRRDGSGFPAELTAAPIVGDGQVQGAVVTMRDVTDCERRESALRASEERLRLVLETARDYAIFTMAPDGTIDGWNSGAERAFGYAADEILGKPGALVFTPEDRAAGTPEAELRKAAETGCAEDERWHLRKDGSYFYATGSVRPLRSDDGRILGFTKIAQDVTDRRRAEREREELLHVAEQARRDAEQANRAKDEFLAVLSHELRSPLNAMVGWLHVLKRAGDDRARREKAVETLQRSVHAQAQVINDLLDVSRIISGKLDVERALVDVGEIARASVEAARPAAEARRLALRCHCPTHRFTVVGDAKRLAQIVDNLLGNAIKFTPPGGRVDVAVEAVDGGVRLRVTDTGTGLSPGFVPHVFEPFRQADSSMAREHGGLGLGLSIVRHLVERHGGTVSASSPGPGHGSTFTVTLPLADAAIRPQAAAAEPAKSNALAGVGVLVVEDDRDSREVMALVLQENGASVYEAESAEDALAVYERERPAVVVSDIGMPRRNGYDLMHDIRRLEGRGRRSVAVAISGFAGPADRDAALTAGFDDHVAKPVEPDTLVRKLETLLAQHAGRPGVA